jgi:thiol-disulfide isomerase/thioredoxin
MKRIFLILGLIPFSMQAVVVEIEGQADLDAKLKEHPKAVIKFYKPNCPACRHIDADYTRISNNIPDVAFLAINTTKPDNATVYPKWGVKGVPSLFFVKNGTKTEVKRDRNFATSFEKTVTTHFK